MATDPSTLYVEEFNTNLQLRAQQRINKFRRAMSVGTHKGKHASPVDQVGLAIVQERTARYEPKNISEIPLYRRWVSPTSYSTHLPVDDLDALKMNVSLGSGYMKAQIAAMNREIDNKSIVGIFGTNYTGEEGTTSEIWDTGQNIAVGTTDLTVAKLKAARKLLLEADVDLDDPEEMISCFITPHQEETLLGESEINNADYGNTIFDKDHGLDGRSWFGINFYVTNRLTGALFADDAAGASADREIPFFAKSGVHLGLWDDVRGTINLRHDLKGDPPEMSVYGTFGATRLESSKVVKIICKET